MRRFQRHPRKTALALVLAFSALYALIIWNPFSLAIEWRFFYEFLYFGALFAAVVLYFRYVAHKKPFPIGLVRVLLGAGALWLAAFYAFFLLFNVLGFTWTVALFLNLVFWTLLIAAALYQNRPGALKYVPAVVTALALITLTVIGVVSGWHGLTMLLYGGVLLFWAGFFLVCFAVAFLIKRMVCVPRRRSRE